MENKDVTEILNEIGAILEIKGENPFKVRAYYAAARNIESLTVNIEKLIEQNKLSEVPGVGESLKEKIAEYVKTGRMKYYDDIKKDVPDGLLEMLKIPSVGPKKVKTLYEELGITNIQELEYACNENKLISLKGFGEKTQEKILEGIKFVTKTKGQFLLSDAIPVGQELYEGLKKCREVKRVSLAGSIRRWKEVVKDIDIVASSDKPKKVMDFFTGLPLVELVTAKGETKTSVRLKSGIPADLRVVTEGEFPYALCHFTGSKEHNIAMRGRAQKMGLKINEYGIFRGEKIIKCRDEEDFFRVLGLSYIPPELRENTQEIELAEKNALPELVQIDNIKGILHVHTNWSDGANSIQEFVNQTGRLGYSYIGLTEHSESAGYAGGLDCGKLRRWIQEVDKMNKKQDKVKILKGIEVDILKDGSLDLSENVLSELDFVIGAIHTNFGMSESEMTNRVIKAIANPLVDILAHPTGRLILGRPGYKINLELVLETAKKYRKVIELNAHPQRLDLDWLHLKSAKALGIKIAICPDAHRVGGLSDMVYGVATARRGWLSSSDVINCMSLEEIKRFFSKN
jgi:DNA polymerase (family 10)